jgi:hypothetical protein
MLATLAIVGALAGVVASGPVSRRFARHPTPERCAAMLDRYAEQQARAYERVPEKGPPPEARALDAPDVVRCARDLTDDEVSCALRAGYVDELERCLP